MGNRPIMVLARLQHLAIQPVCNCKCSHHTQPLGRRQRKSTFVTYVVKCASILPVGRSDGTPYIIPDTLGQKIDRFTPSVIPNVHAFLLVAGRPRPQRLHRPPMTTAPSMVLPDLASSSKLTERCFHAARVRRSDAYMEPPNAA
jgi:hypothetical protein